MQPAVMHARKMQLLRLHAMHAHCSNTKMRTGCQVSSEGGTGRQLANDHVARCPVVGHHRRAQPRQQVGQQHAAGRARNQVGCVSSCKGQEPRGRARRAGESSQHPYPHPHFSAPALACACMHGHSREQGLVHCLNLGQVLAHQHCVEGQRHAPGHARVGLPLRRVAHKAQQGLHQGAERAGRKGRRQQAGGSGVSLMSRQRCALRSLQYLPVHTSSAGGRAAAAQLAAARPEPEPGRAPCL